MARVKEKSFTRHQYSELTDLFYGSVVLKPSHRRQKVLFGSCLFT